MAESAIPAGLDEHDVPLPTGVTLYAVEQAGAGTPVICLHGIWDDWRYWLPLLSPGPGPFAGRPVVMIDLRGHGGSSKPEHGYSWNDYAADVLAFIRDRSYDRVMLAGHSLGALVSLLVAAELPDRIEALLLEDPPLPVRHDRSSAFAGLLEMKQQTLAAIIDDFSIWRPHLSPEQAEASARRLKNTADGVFRDLIEGASAGIEMPKPGVTIEAPTLVIQAGLVEERAFGEGGEALLALVIPDLRIETVEGTTHNVLREQPEPYRAILSEFFNGQDIA